MNGQAATLTGVLTALLDALCTRELASRDDARSAADDMARLAAGTRV